MKRILACTLAVAGLALGAAPAQACGGFFCMRQPMDQAGEKILFIQDGERVSAHVQVNYQGDAKQFSWVVPTPSKPTLAAGTDALFQTLMASTAPSFQLDLKTIGDCPPPPMPAPGMAFGGNVQEGGVQVVSRGQVGPYDTAVIQSNDPGALKTWLRKNGYTLPAKLDPLLDPYVAGKYYFVALKLQQDRGTGDLQPIVLKYNAVKAGIPIRLTGVAATPDMNLYVWVLGEKRAVPENYRHARINEAKINWVNGGNNYTRVVTQAVNEAGGQAFVTDYAGDSHIVGLSAFRGEKMNLTKLSRLTDPVLFLRAIQDDGYFQSGSATALAFVKRFVPIPKSMGNVWEPGFYSNPEQYADQLHKLGVRVDARKAAAELEETVVKPYRDVLSAFAAHPYLTRMYTTMSPEEMTQDPLFRFNSTLPEVSNVHKAKGVRDCRKVKDLFRAPVRITLRDGRRFTIREGRDPDDKQDGRRALPAAEIVEQLRPEGPPMPIMDNRGRIGRALADLALEPDAVPAPAVGVLNETVPARDRAPATGAVLATLLGVLGWRRLRRR